jgi:hypothetical protein
VTVLVSCQQGTEVVQSKAEADWQPALAPQQIAMVRSQFPDFQPELFKPGTDPSNRGALRPSNFQPAMFFGAGNVSEQAITTPLGITVYIRGFDASRLPAHLNQSFPYFDSAGSPYQLALGVQRISALNKIEERMHLPATPNGPLIEFDPKNWQVVGSEIDRILMEVRASLAFRLPAVANVSPSNCAIEIFPTIFWVRNSNFGDTWAVGLTNSMPAGRYHLALNLFYVSGNRIQNDWRRVLIDEAINFFVLSIGRPDLAL